MHNCNIYSSIALHRNFLRKVNLFELVIQKYACLHLHSRGNYSQVRAEEPISPFLSNGKGVHLDKTTIFFLHFLWYYLTIRTQGGDFIDVMEMAA
jgi:hypothetical protein